MSVLNFKDTRSRLLAKNVLGSVLVKGWASLVVFLLVPLTLHLLGEYANGLWMTISAILVWCDQMDIGLGNGLRNRLAVCMAHDEVEKAREAVSSTLAMLVAIVIPMAALLLTVVWTTDIYSLLNVDPSRIDRLQEMLSAVVIIFSSTFVLRIVGNVFMGLQLPAANAAIGAIGQTLALVGTLIIYYIKPLFPFLASSGSMLTAIAIVNTAGPAITFGVAFLLTFGRWRPILRPRAASVNWGVARELISTGIQFFILQIAGIILFTSSNLVIQLIFSPEVVTPYQIVYRYFTIVMMVFGIIATPFWSATTDAVERGDMAWIISSGRRLNFCLLSLYGMVALMVIASQPFYRLWIGKDIAIPSGLTFCMALYTVVFITSIRYSTILNGCGKLRVQLIMTVTAALLFIPLSLGVTRIYPSLPALVLVMTAVNLPGLIVNIVQYHKIINHTAKGIWNK